MCLLLPDVGVKEVRKKVSITVSQYAVMLGGWCLGWVLPPTTHHPNIVYRRYIGTTLSIVTTEWDDGRKDGSSIEHKAVLKSLNPEEKYMIMI